MLLIDAYNITHGGGKTLLDYLIISLKERDVQYILMKRSQYNDLFGSRYSPDFYKRNILLKHYTTQYRISVLLCFGNFPPSIKLKKIRVYTYLQNALLLKDSDLSSFSVVFKLKMLLKRLYLNCYLRNSDFFIVQTEVMRDRFLNTSGFDQENVLVFPFYDENAILKYATSENCKKPNHFIYVSSPSPHKNHTMLLATWKRLAIDGVFPTLYLTIGIQEKSKFLVDKITEIQNLGGTIINLGPTKHTELLKQISKCSFTIFPSVEETLGLGMIEGILLGNKVLCSDLNYWSSTLIPSIKFDHRSISSVYNSVISALDGELPKSKLLIKDNVNDLINCLNYNDEG